MFVFNIYNIYIYTCLYLIYIYIYIYIYTYTYIYEKSFFHVVKYMKNVKIK